MSTNENIELINTRKVYELILKNDHMQRNDERERERERERNVNYLQPTR